MRFVICFYIFLVTVARKCSSLSNTKSIFDRLVVTVKSSAPPPPNDAESTKSRVAFVPSKVTQTENPKKGEFLANPIIADEPNVEPYQENKLSSEIRPKTKSSSEVRPKNKPSSEIRPKTKPSSEIRPQNKPSSKVKPGNKPSSSVRPRTERSAEVRLKNQKKKAQARQKRRYFEEFHPQPEGMFMKYYREEQKEQDYVQCHKIFTPFWKGLKVHPKNHKVVKTYYPNDYLCIRLIQILNMNMTRFDVEDLHGVLQVLRKMKLRLFFWHHNSIKVLLNTIIEGSTRPVNRPILQTTYQPLTTSCKSNTTDEHYGHTHKFDYNMPVIVTQGVTNALDDIKKVIRDRDENEAQYKGEQQDIAGDTDVSGDAEKQDGNIEYIEADLKKTDYVLPSLKEVEDLELKDPYNHEYSDLDGDEVIRAKVDQYDMEAIGNYDHLELPINEAGDSIVFQELKDATVGQTAEDNLKNLPYEELNEPNPEYEDNTETVGAQNQDKLSTDKVMDEKIYNEAEEYIENIFAGLE